ncbi:hypothetical protein ABBQ32_009866 [Trebouxia sp. C0010 RCD-2024]
MGSEKQKKSHKRKHSEDSDNDTSADSGVSHQHKKSKKSKKEKKEKHKKSKKDDKLLKEAKKFLKQKLNGEGVQAPESSTPIDSSTQITNIGKDDYFVKNAEFTTWLTEHRSKFFNELDSDETRALFGEFVEDWNGRKLSAKYYAGLTGSSNLRRTKHQWGIRPGGDADLAAGAVGMAAAMEEEREAEQAARQGQQVERRKWRTDQKEWLEEQLPKATGREAQLEKKAARREAAREREQSPDMSKLPGGGDIMGGDDSFAAARAREARKDDWRSKQQAVKQDLLSQKLAAANAQEQAKMAMFHNMLPSGAKLTIPKRQ